MATYFPYSSVIGTNHLFVEISRHPYFGEYCVYQIDSRSVMPAAEKISEIYY